MQIHCPITRSKYVHSVCMCVCAREREKGPLPQIYSERTRLTLSHKHRVCLYSANKIILVLALNDNDNDGDGDEYDDDDDGASHRSDATSHDDHTAFFSDSKFSRRHFHCEKWKTFIISRVHPTPRFFLRASSSTAGCHPAAMKNPNRSATAGRTEESCRCARQWR